MALGPGPGGGGFTTPGARQLASSLGFSGASSAKSEDELTIWDIQRSYFSQTLPMPKRYKYGNVGDWKDAAIAQGRDRQRRAARQQRQDRNRLKQAAGAAGINADDPVQLSEFWLNAVEQAEAASAVTPEVTPWDIIDGWAQGGYPGSTNVPASPKYEENLDKQKRDFFAKKIKPWTEKSTSRNIQLTDPDTARALVTQYLEQTIGRRPKDSEIKDFVSALNKKERANPTVTTTVERFRYDEERGPTKVSSDTTTRGGPPSPTAFAQNFTEDEYEGEERAYRAGVEYSQVLDALFA